MKIVNEYRMKDGLSLQDVLGILKENHIPFNNGGSFVHEDSSHVFFRDLAEDISVNVALPKDLSTWDSYDHVLILDEMSGQPYYPFYKADEDERRRFPFVLNIIGVYNKFMDSLDFLEKIQVDE